MDIDDCAASRDGSTAPAHQAMVEYPKKPETSSRARTIGFALIAVAITVAVIVVVVVMVTDSDSSDGPRQVDDGGVNPRATPSPAGPGVLRMPLDPILPGSLLPNETAIAVELDANCLQVGALSGAKAQQFRDAVADEVIAKLGSLGFSGASATTGWPPLCGSTVVDVLVQSPGVAAARGTVRRQLAASWQGAASAAGLRKVAEELGISGSMDVLSVLGAAEPPEVIVTPPGTVIIDGVVRDTGEIVDPRALAGRLPLTVAAVVPPAGTQLEGRGALTVVFSRSVVALGAVWAGEDGGPSAEPSAAVLSCDGEQKPPGRWRWATTSILRYDPTQDWPTDLACTLTLKDDLETFDGTRLSGTRLNAEYKTRALSISGVQVSSPLMRNLTGGMWASQADWDQPHEVPGDGVMEVSFSYPIAPSRAVGLLDLKGNGGAADLSPLVRLAGDGKCRERYYTPYRAYAHAEPYGGGGGQSAEDSGLRSCVAVSVDRCTPKAAALCPRDTLGEDGCKECVAGLLQHCGGTEYGGLYCSGAANPPSGAGDPDAAEWVLQLKTGTRPTQWAGAVRAAGQTHKLHNTYPFAFPFRSDANERWQKVRNPRLRFWLRHGLLPPVQKQLANIAPTLQLTTGGSPVTVGQVALMHDASGKVQLGTLMMEAPLRPAATYRLTVTAPSGGDCSAAGSVCDGTGLPLQSGSFDFSTGGADGFISDPSGDLHFPSSDAPAQWWLLKKNSINRDNVDYRNVVHCQGREYRAANVGTSERDIIAMLNHFRDGASYFSTHPGVIASPRGAEGMVEEQALDAVALFGQSGVFLRTTTENMPGTPSGCQGNRVSHSHRGLVQRAPFHLVAVAASQGEAAWVEVRALDAATLLPVQGVEVHLYHTPWRWEQESVRRIGGQQLTDAEGRVRLGGAAAAALGCGGSSTAITGVKDGALVVLRDVQIHGRCGSKGGPAVSGVAFADRGFYRRGDEVAVAGWLFSVESRASDATPQPLRGGRGYRIETDWGRASGGSSGGSWAGGEGGGDVMPVGAGEPMAPAPRGGGGGKSKDMSESVDLELDPQTGSFSVRLRVPADAPPSTRSQLRLLDPEGEEVGSATVLVADPRVPTARLNLSAPPVYRPGAAIEVALEASSYSGSPIPQQRIALTWELQPLPTDEATGRGEVEAVTGVDGRATATIDAGAAAATASGLRITATWQAPTRELLQETAAVPVRVADWEITGARFQPYADLPGIEAEWGATLQPAPGAGDAGSSAAVAVKAYRLPDGTEYDADIDQTATAGASCTATPGARSQQGGYPVSCSLALPSVGRWAVVATIADSQGRVAKSVIYAGRTAGDWRSGPLRSLPGLSATPAAAEVALGDEAELQLELPYAEAAVIVTWGSDSGANGALHHIEGAKGTVRVRIGSECAVWCNVHLVAVGKGVAPHAAASLAALTEVASGEALPAGDALEGVRASPLFDPDTLSVREAWVRLQVARPAAEAPIPLSLTLPTDAVLPGSTVSVSLQTEPGAEVFIAAVDQAVLDLAPSPLLRPAETSRELTESAMRRSGAHAYWHPQSRTTARQSSSSRQLAAAKAVALRRARQEPWWTPQIALGGDWSQEYDIADSDWQQSQSAPATQFPQVMYNYRGGGGMFSEPNGNFDDGEVMAAMPGVAADGAGGTSTGGAPAPPPSDMDQKARSGPSEEAGGGNSGAEAGVGRAMRTDFRSTAVQWARVEVGQTGSASYTFTLPDNAGAWAVRAVGAKGVRFGAAEGQLTARRPLTLQPSVPRVARVYDNFTAGCVVTEVDGEKQVTFELSADPAFGVRVTRQTQLVRAGSEVLFHFSAERWHPEAKVSVTAQVVGQEGEGDSFRIQLPVLAPQMGVDTATSFTVAGTAAGNVWDEGLMLPPALPGSGWLSLTASVGYLAAVRAAAETLRLQVVQDDEPSGALLAAVLSEWTAALRYGNATAAAEAGAFWRHHVQGQITALTLPNLGLVWRLPRWWTPEYPDVRLNSWAARLAHELLSEAAGNGGGDTAALRSVEDLKQQWIAAARNGVVESTRRALARGYSHDWEGIGWAHYAGAFRGMNFDAQLREVLPFPKLLQARDRLSEGGKLRLALTVLEDVNRDEASVAPIGTILTDLHAQLRVQGRTAYIAWGTQGDAAPFETQALGITAFTLAIRGAFPCGATSCAQALQQPLVAKVAAHVAQGESQNNYSPWRWGFAPEQSAARISALSAYDKAQGSAKPDLKLVAVASTAAPRSMLLAAAWRPGVPPEPTQLAYSFADVTAIAPGTATEKADRIRFLAQGTGEASVAMGLHFVPAVMPQRGAYFGLWVEKALRVAGGAQLTQRADGSYAVSPGTVVEVVMQVTTADDLIGGVELVDLTCAGLEPQDPELKQPEVVRHSATGRGKAHSGGMTSFDWWETALWRGSFEPAKVLPDQVRCWAHYLPRGTHTCTYTAVATTSGEFALPPARAAAALQPELMGLSPTGLVRVAART